MQEKNFLSRSFLKGEHHGLWTSWRPNNLAKTFFQKLFCKVVWSPWCTFWFQTDELKEVMESGRGLTAVYNCTSLQTDPRPADLLIEVYLHLLSPSYRLDTLDFQSFLSFFVYTVLSFYLSCHHLIHKSAMNKLRKYLWFVHIISFPNPVLFPSLCAYSHSVKPLIICCIEKIYCQCLDILYT